MNRQLFYISIFCILLGACSKEGGGSNQIILKGKILNAENQSIKISLFRNIAEKENEELEVKINEHNDFRFEITADHWQMGKIHIDESSAYIFLEPSDSIYLLADARNFEETLYFSGKGANNCEYFNKSYGSFESRPQLLDNRIKTQSLKTGKAFKVYRDSIREKHIQFYQEHENNLSDGANKVALAQINCRWANKLFDYPTIHLFLNEKEIKPDFEASYHDFTEAIDLDEEDLLVYKKYIDYLDNYLDHQLKLQYKYKGLKYNQDHIYDDYGKYADLYQLSAFHLKGKVKETMQAYYLTKAMERGRFTTVKKEFESFSVNSQYEEFRIPVNSSYQKFALVANGQPAPDFKLISSEGGHIALSDFKGKAVYLDFWASWCIPCLKLVPSAKELKKEFKKEEIVFLNVSIDENEEAWQKMIEKHKIGGVNLISKGIASPMAQQYGIKALPRYMLIDKKGIIVNNDFKKPDDESIKDDLRELLGK